MNKIHAVKKPELIEQLIDKLLEHDRFHNMEEVATFLHVDKIPERRGRAHADRAMLAQATVVDTEAYEEKLDPDVILKNKLLIALTQAVASSKQRPLHPLLAVSAEHHRGKCEGRAAPYGVGGAGRVRRCRNS